MRTFKTKTLFKGMAWIRDMDLERLEAGDSIQVKYVGKDHQQGRQEIKNGQVMTLTPEHIPTLRKNQSDKKFGSRFSSKQYWLWGIPFKPDVEKQASLFNS